MTRNVLRTVILAGTFTMAMCAQEAVREDRQQDRVAQGVKSGQMTPGETAKVEGHEAKINHEVRKDRAANGGTLTKGEKAKVAHQQNHESKVIADDKHNAVKQ